MAVSFPPNFSPEVQAASIQGFKNAAAASQTAPLRYPQKSIGRDDDYLEIGVIQYVPPGFDFKKDQAGTDTLQLTTGSERNSNIKADYTIQLPIPANIGDTNQVDWGSGDTINSLAAYGAKSIGGVIQSGNLGKGTIDALKSAGMTTVDVLTRGGGQGAIVDQFASALVNVFGANTTPEQLRSRATGQVLNPNLELLFSGVNLRSFPFEFDFAPRNSAESNVVKQIIRIFKQSMAPKTGSNTSGAGLFISAPNIFLLKYKTGSRDHPYLNKFKPCALTNMSVNYTGSGSYATYTDKTPVHMKLTLSFTELNPIYNEDYDSNVGKQAVGY
jgi:hypothetical protein